MSVQLPDQQGAPLVHHLPIKQHKTCRCHSCVPSAVSVRGSCRWKRSSKVKAVKGVFFIFLSRLAVVHLEGSSLVFDDIFKLISFYSVSRWTCANIYIYINKMFSRMASQIKSSSLHP